jgi:hypothetical protein
MIERLRAFSSPSRYLIYVAGVLVVLAVAVGVGAAAAVVVGWQSGRVATGPAETNALEGSKLERTSAAKAPENAAVESSSDPKNPDDKASFTHRATDENSRGDYTYIGDPSINGDRHAIVLVSPTSDQESLGTASYRHNIGVWYEAGPGSGRSSTRIEQRCQQEPPSRWKFRKHPRSSSTMPIS